ncbi:MAG: SurA N-terminal domain-containing protein [Nitrospirae bacterium]|nr:SurA N-terminal domain-containing protein [Candidatus Manganitrophaceae bacterium]
MKKEFRSQASGVSSQKSGMGNTFFWILTAGFWFRVFLAPPALFAAEEVVAAVNQAPITAEALNREVQTYLRQIGHRELSSDRMAMLRREMLNKLIDEELLYQEALKQGWKVTEAETEAEVDRIRKRFSTQHDFEAALVKEGLTLDAVEAGVRRFVLVRRMWSALPAATETEKKGWLQTVRERSDIRIYEVR